MNSEEQERAWYSGWRPAGYEPPSQDEKDFAAEHPGWVQAAWAHPHWKSWLMARQKKSQQANERAKQKARQSELKRHLQNALAELYPAQHEDKLNEYDQERLAEIIETLHDISSGVAR